MDAFKITGNKLLGKGMWFNDYLSTDNSWKKNLRRYSRRVLKMKDRLIISKSKEFMKNEE